MNVSKLVTARLWIRSGETCEVLHRIPCSTESAHQCVSGMLTWTTRPPFSRLKTRNWVSRAPRNCSWTFWSPARRSAGPGTGNQCTEPRAWASVFCWACPRVTWGWFCAATRTPRLGTESSDARARSPWRAASAGPPETEGCRCRCCCCCCCAFCSASRALGYPRPRRSFCSGVFSCCSASAVASLAPPRCFPDCPLETPGSWAPLASALLQTSPPMFGERKL